jgi:AbrB family looped-hinge helix DNA binding protein
MPQGSFTVRVGRQGRLVLPAELRRELHVQAGDVLMGRREDDHIVLELPDTIRARLRGRFRTAEGVSVVDELLAERQAEAEREQP